MLTQCSALESFIHNCSESICHHLVGNESSPVVKYRHIVSTKDVQGIPNFLNSCYYTTLSASGTAGQRYIQLNTNYDNFTGTMVSGSYNGTFSQTLTGGYSSKPASTGIPIYLYGPLTVTDHEWDVPPFGASPNNWDTATTVHGTYGIWIYNLALSGLTDNAGTYTTQAASFMNYDFNTSQSGVSNRDFSSQLVSVGYNCPVDVQGFTSYTNYTITGINWNNYSGSDIVTLNGAGVYGALGPRTSRAGCISCISGWTTNIGQASYTQQQFIYRGQCVPTTKGLHDYWIGRWRAVLMDSGVYGVQLDYIQEGLIYSGSIVGQGGGADISMPFPTSNPWFSYVGTYPVLEDFYFTVVGQESDSWLKQYGFTASFGFYPVIP